MTNIANRLSTISLAAMTLALAGTATSASAQDIPGGSTANGTNASNPAGQQAAGDVGIADIVVTARKTAENVQRTPLAITAFTGADIEARQILGVKDLTKSTPGLIFTGISYDTFAQLVTIRGVTATDVLLVSEPAVGIYVDGVYQGTTQGTGLSDVFDLDRVEVLKGPQGTLYGRNSTGGAVSIYTNLPSYDGWSGKVKVGLGNYDTMQGAAQINVPIVQDKLALRLVAQYFDRGKGFGTEVTSGKGLEKLSTQVIRGTLRADPTDKLQIVLRGDYSHGYNTGKITKVAGAQNPLPFAVALAGGLQLGLPSAFGMLSPDPTVSGPAYVTTATAVRNFILGEQPAGHYDAVYSPNGQYYNKIRSGGGSATIAYQFSDAATLKSITAYRFIKKINPSDTDGSSLLLIDPRINGVDAKQFTQEVQLTGSIFDNRLKYALGGYYYHGFGRDFNTVNALFPINPTNPANFNAHVDDKSYAGYFQATYTVVEGLRVTGGIRYTDETKILISRTFNAGGCGVAVSDRPDPAVCEGKFKSPFTNWSYTGSIDYQVTPTTLLYARTSKGFKAGGINERGTAVAGTYAPFKPETLTDYEVGIKTDLFDHRLRINMAAFTSAYKGIQQTVVVPGPGGNPISIIANTGRAKIQGGELEVTAKPFPELLLRGTYALTDAKLTKGFQVGNPDNLIQGNAKHQASASFVYTLPTDFGNVSAGMNYSYRSRVDFNTGNHLPGGAAVGVPASLAQQAGYGLVDGRLGFHVENGDFNVAIFGRNLTNKFYKSAALDLAGAGLGLVLAYSGEPRTYGIEFSKNF